jgi:hypothetical protein
MSRQSGREERLAKSGLEHDIGQTTKEY